MSPSIHQNLHRSWSRWNGWLEFSWGVSVQERPPLLTRSTGRELWCWISLLDVILCCEPHRGRRDVTPNRCQVTAGCVGPWVGTDPTAAPPLWGRGVWSPGFLGVGKGIPAEREQWQPCFHLSTYWNPTFSQVLQDPKVTPKWPHAQHLPACSFWAQNKETLNLPASTGKGSSSHALNICVLCHILPEPGKTRSLCALNREPTFTETCDLSPIVNHCSSCNMARRSCSCLLWIL